jgi:LAS superfamily LD-carboxypeptidase LdcB
MQTEAVPAEQQTILTRLDNLRANSNFYSKQIYIRDQLVVNVFVNHDKLDLNGRPLGEVLVDTELLPSNNPGIQFSQEEETKETSIPTEESSDATDTESDNEVNLVQLAEEESKKDAQSEITTSTVSAGHAKSGISQVEESDVDDEQKTSKEIINRYTIDLIA